MKPTMLADVKHYAAKQGISVRLFVREAIGIYLEANRAQELKEHEAKAADKVPA